MLRLHHGTDRVGVSSRRLPSGLCVDQLGVSLRVLCNGPREETAQSADERIDNRNH
jgi:hypothetical protein